MVPKANNLTEFEIINNFLDVGAFDRGKDVIVGPGDDCAIVRIPPGHNLAYSIDTQVAGVHFPVHVDGSIVAQRSLGSSASDLAAMGAKPHIFTIALTLPTFDNEWLRGFTTAMARMALDLQITLVGGDLTRGPMTVTVHVSGLLKDGQGLQRAGAKPGDDIYVSGSVGDAAAGLQILMDKRIRTEQEDFLVSRFCLPQPRLELGQHLVTIASSAIDISDGLVADLTHICQMSHVGARVEADRVPLSDALKSTQPTHALEMALNGGDDYEICFTANPGFRQEIRQVSDVTAVPITRIGCISDDESVTCIDAEGNIVSTGRGYQHFDVT
jgi:thiamine-monophosphate kinase